MNQTNLHKPVLLKESLEFLNIASGTKVVIDATLGLGGHTEAMLKLNPELTVIGIDRDGEALERASLRLSEFGSRFLAFRGTYDQLEDALSAAGVDKADGILADLGVSSMQLDFPERGFSYSQNAPLDMRMDQSAGIAASELIEKSSISELAYLIKTYGEEKFARLIAKHIAGTKFSSSEQLNEVIASVVPKPHKGHPAKRTYQALRIAVNNEMEILESFVPKAIDALGPNRRLVVISYHSLEDSIVKKAMQKASTSSAPVGLPVELDQHKPILRMLTRGVFRPSDEEIEQNPRSASARLRAAEKLEEK
jgi:16S rRNA (cytosine1402-N4)-methyltransferase